MILAGWEAYKYYMGLMMAVGALGTATLLLATAFFRHEIAVRNFWVFALSITVVSVSHWPDDEWAFTEFFCVQYESSQFSPLSSIIVFSLTGTYVFSPDDFRNDVYISHHAPFL